MRKTKITGYMLGNENHIVLRGDQWSDAGEYLYICTNKEFAQTILEHSQQCVLEPNNIIWTTIYRVHANNINIDKYSHGNNLAWTAEGNKIIVDKPVFYRKAISQSEQRLLNNAIRIRSDFFKIFNNKNKELKR